jgi:hypothetical protein
MTMVHAPQSPIGTAFLGSGEARMTAQPIEHGCGGRNIVHRAPLPIE